MEGGVPVLNSICPCVYYLDTACIVYMHCPFLGKGWWLWVYNFFWRRCWLYQIHVFYSWIVVQGLGNLRNSIRQQNEQGGLRDQSSSSSDASARPADVPLDSMQLPVNFTVLLRMLLTSLTLFSKFECLPFAILKFIFFLIRLNVTWNFFNSLLCFFLTNTFLIKSDFPAGYCRLFDNFVPVLDPFEGYKW